MLTDVDHLKTIDERGSHGAGAAKMQELAQALDAHTHREKAQAQSDDGRFVVVMQKSRSTKQQAV